MTQGSVTVHPRGKLTLEDVTARAVRYAARMAPLLLAVLPFLFFWRLFAPNPLDRMWLPDGDLVLQYFPLRVFAANEIAAGRLPLWNPHMYAGQPGLADSQMAALYPIHLLTALLLGAFHQRFTFAILQGQIVLHSALAALFTYAFALRLARRRAAAWVAALVFTFGGYLISYPAQQPAILESAVWLPLVLLLLDWAAPQELRARRVWALACAGAAMALSILAGHPQTFLYVFYTAAAWGFWRLLESSRPAGSGAAPRRMARVFSALFDLVIFAVFAIGLSAAQLLPTLEFTRYSTRAQPGYNFTSSGFALNEIITLLIPGYFGGLPLYVGIVPLLLAGFAVWKWMTTKAITTRSGKAKPAGTTPDGSARTSAVVPMRSTRAIAFFVALALLALFLSFGDASFVYPLFYLLAPGFAQVRDQERAALLWSFALAMLAALGAAHFWTPWSRAARKHIESTARLWGWLLGAMLVLLALAYIGALADEGAKVNLFPGALRQLVPGFFWLLGAWALWRLRLHTAVARRWLLLGGLALIWLNLFSVNGQYNFQKPTPVTYFPETSLSQALRDELQTNPLARVSSEGLLPGAHNAGAEYGFADINGNDPLHLDAWEQFDRQVLELRRFQLLGVQYVVTKRIIEHGAFAQLAAEGDARLYRFSGALPRAWLAHDALVVAPDRQLESLNDPAFDPSAAVILRAPPALALTPGAPGADDVTFIAQSAGRLALRVRASTNAVLVFGEVYYPGWQLTVDDQRVEPLPADGILMATALPAGAHDVELTFAPDLFTIGVAISIMATLVGLASAIYARRTEAMIRDAAA